LESTSCSKYDPLADTGRMRGLCGGGGASVCRGEERFRRYRLGLPVVFEKATWGVWIE
jgi:hypothetical protein